LNASERTELSRSLGDEKIEERLGTSGVGPLASWAVHGRFLPSYGRKHVQTRLPWMQITIIDRPETNNTLLSGLRVAFIGKSGKSCPPNILRGDHFN
jgi:hypothetical protein